MYKVVIKPFFDVLIAVVLLILISPLFVIITFILLFLNNGKPFFTQLRPGKNEKVFKLLKFKSMNDKRDSNGELLSDMHRLTIVGKFIRKTSLDEIPQLINVIAGDMSFVGPRPLLVQYLPLYNEEQKKRHLVKPGITGWAQVNGRNGIGWSQKFEFDVWYANNISLWLDLKIAALTLKQVISSEGVNQSNTETMEYFKGN